MSKKLLNLLLMSTLLITLSAAVFLRTRTSIFNVSAVEETANIGVYSNKECTNPVFSIYWGALSPGQTVNVTMYVRNEGNESILLVEETTGWSPTYSIRYLHFSWSYQNRRIEAGVVVPLTQTLYVSRNIIGISNFTFNINFTSAKLADLGGGVQTPQFFAFDGKVDSSDLTLFLQCCRGTAPPEAMYLGDLGGADGITPQFFAFDGKVDSRDVLLFVQCYKGTAQPEVK